MQARGMCTRCYNRWRKKGLSGEDNGSEKLSTRPPIRSSSSTGYNMLIPESQQEFDRIINFLDVLAQYKDWKRTEIYALVKKHNEWPVTPDWPVKERRLARSSARRVFKGQSNITEEVRRLKKIKLIGKKYSNYKIRLKIIDELKPFRYEED